MLRKRYRKRCLLCQSSFIFRVSNCCVFITDLHYYSLLQEIVSACLLFILLAWFSLVVWTCSYWFLSNLFGLSHTWVIKTAFITCFPSLYICWTSPTLYLPLPFAENITFQEIHCSYYYESSLPLRISFLGCIVCLFICLVTWMECFTEACSLFSMQTLKLLLTNKILLVQLPQEQWANTAVSEVAIHN